MDIPRLERLTVKVHLLGEPCLWCWEIVDMEDDTPVESSWAMEWTGYPSSQEALQAGAIRLTDLTRSRRGAKLDARLTPAGGQRAQPRYLVVVARAATELYTSLTRTFADSDSIEVIRDRRFSERRQATILWGSIAAEATAALGYTPKGKSDGVNGRGCSSLAFLRHYRRTNPERLRQHHQRRKGVQATRIVPRTCTFQKVSSPLGTTILILILLVFPLLVLGTFESSWNPERASYLTPLLPSRAPALTFSDGALVAPSSTS